MQRHITIRIPKRLLRSALLLAVLSAVIAPIAVSASHDFTDVPDTNIFHSNIGWMSDNGITAGCNPPANDLYCPSDNVTREQMAAFMQRLAEGKVVDAATAVNAETADDADMLDGLDANQLTRVAYAVSDDDALVGAGAGDDVLTTSMTAPVDGYLVIDASSDVYNTGASDLETTCSVRLDTTLVRSADRTIRVDTSGNPNGEENCSTNTVVPVTAGTYDVTFAALSAPTGIIYDEAALTVMFVPFDGEGNPPTDFTVTGTGPTSAGN